MEQEVPKVREFIYCVKCGEKNAENNYKCTRCGFVLHPPAHRQQVVSSDNTLGGLIPYKNPKALWAYYLGIFSLIPFLGIVLGLAALTLGIMGVSYSDRNPEAKGKIHAWIGLVLGGLSLLGHIYFFLTLGCRG